MKKIIHLSDLHIGYEECGAKFRTIISGIFRHMQPVEDYIIVITGDLINNANNEEEWTEAVNAIDTLKEMGYTVLPIPGNHCYGNGTWGDKKFVKKFKSSFYGNINITYPKIDIYDGILFIGLDSTADELHWYDRMFAEGELGATQLRKLKKVINKPEYSHLKKVVYLHHHPFDFKIGLQLKDREKLKPILENKIDVLLYGHMHDDSDTAGKNYNGTWGIPRAYNAGSSTHKNGDCGIHRVIDLNSEPSKDYDAKFL